MYEELLEKVENLVKEKGIHRIAIDGRCGSGKSTFGGLLAQRLQADLIRMDDFFLQKYQRTRERYATPGENVDHERVKEVLLQWERHQPFSYERLECPSFTLVPYARIEHPSDCLVVEGTYSFHRELRDFYDLKIFFTISSEKQKERIRLRNGEEGLQEFEKRWIPLEELYFTGEKTMQYADIWYNSDTDTYEIRSREKNYVWNNDLSALRK